MVSSPAALRVAQALPPIARCDDASALAWLEIVTRLGFLRRNEGYSYASYGEVFRRYFFHAKDPVPHPLWQRRQ